MQAQKTTKKVSRCMSIGFPEEKGHLEPIVPPIGDIQQCDALLFGEPLPVLVDRLKYFRRLERAWNIVASSYAESGLDLKTVTSNCGISKNHLNLLLGRTISCSFHAFLVRYRIRKAIELILERNYSVTEIAYQVGFGSVAAFNRNFRALMFTSPSQFRRLALAARGIAEQSMNVATLSRSRVLTTKRVVAGRSDSMANLGVSQKPVSTR